MVSFRAAFGFRNYISNAWLAYVITSVRCVIYVIFIGLPLASQLTFIEIQSDVCVIFDGFFLCSIWF